MLVVKIRKTSCLCASVCLLFFYALSFANQLKQVAVASAHPMATQAGVEILQKGGNVFDAAAAITASLAVVEPYGSGLGGGGFWLLHRAADGYQVMIDGREKAPIRAGKNIYLDHDNNVIDDLSIDGPMAAGIPGVPAGIEHLVKKYGRLSLKEVLGPAIRQAREGFRVTPHYQKLMAFRSHVVRQYPYAASIFLPGNDVPAIGRLIVQNDLANTLSVIANKGKAGFYEGVVAKKLINSVKQHGGIWELGDLKNYDIVEREPVEFNYHEIKITSATLPSSGGIVLAQTLQMLEHFDLEKYSDIDRKHLVVEAMRRAYRDRAAYLGDTDYIDVPIGRLLNRDYIHGMASTIDVNRATQSNELAGIATNLTGGENTTHFSIIDSDGNRVSATLSINFPFGSGFAAEGTGILLNNEMDDFSIKPLTANSYGLVGNAANAIAPGKRPLSSMTPTFIESSDSIAVLGTPGGSRIISMVLLGVLDYAQGRLPSSWVSVPRYHHQYLPDQILFENGALTINEQRVLAEKGHRLKENNRKYGNMQAVMLWKLKNYLFAASDPRGEGSAEVIVLPY